MLVGWRSCEALSHKDSGLRIVVVALARLKTVALVEARGGFHVVGGVEIDPLVAGRVRELFGRLQHFLGDSLAPRFWPDVHALDFGAEGFGQVAQSDAPDDVVAGAREPKSRTGTKIIPQEFFL